VRSASLPAHVFLTADAVGGLWTYAVDLAAGLAARDVRVTLATLGPSPSAAQQRQAGAIAGVELIDARLPLDWLEEDTSRFDDIGDALAALANRSGADIVHLNSPVFAASSFSAPVIGGCHSCLATWWDAVRGGEMPESFGPRTDRLRRGYAACSALIAPSAAFAEATRVRYGVEPIAIHNGRAPAAMPSESKRPVALTAGRLWDPAKNLAALDAAAAMMRGAVEAAGPLTGPNGDRTTTTAVVALGPLDPEDMAGRLSEASAFVSLALYEPFGLSVLEAAYAGCALVLADIPTFRELWSGAAVFVDPRDPAAVAAALDGMLEDQDERGRLGALAAARAGRFTLDAMTDGTLGVYAEALSRVSDRSAA
jgi:glycosyltransferase involved in cell wall biosynthesis